MRETNATDTRGSAWDLPWASAAVAFAAWVGYLAIAPGVGNEGDGSELTLVLAVGGVAHPSGYPLYTLLGSAFCRALHAAGLTWWFAANAWSATGAAVALGLLHALSSRLARAAGARGPLAFASALLPVLVLAFHPVWIPEATTAEVNSWHLAWVMGACLACLAWLEAIGPMPPAARLVSPASRSTPAPGPDAARAACWGALCGAGLAHHLTSVMFAVPLTASLVWALARSRRWRPALLAAGLGGMLVPLASYAFVAWRAWHPAAYQWPLLERSLSSVVEHIRGAKYSFYVGGFHPKDAQRRELARWVYPVLGLGLPLLVAMRPRAGRAGRVLITAVLAAAVLQGAFVANYGVIDPEPYFLPLLGVALLGLPLLAARAPGSANGRAGIRILSAALIAVFAWGGVRCLRAQNQRLEYVERRTRLAWHALTFQRGVVFWHNDMFTRLLAYQVLDGEKPGLVITNPGLMTFEGPRERFRQQVGVDPLAGLDLETDDDLLRIAPNVARQIRLPVADFDQVLAGVP